MTERVKSGLMRRGLETGLIAMLVRHCQTKGAETDRHFLRIPRQSSTLLEV